MEIDLLPGVWKADALHCNGSVRIFHTHIADDKLQKRLALRQRDK
jgi:hypothetical protein